jgi:hypothetical protein
MSTGEIREPPTPHCAEFTFGRAERDPGLHAGTTLCRPGQTIYIDCMKTKRLTDVLERVENWPTEWKEKLTDIALDIDAGLKDGVYYPTPEELAGIDRGLRDAEQGRLATDEEVEQAFAKFRGA